MITEITKKIYKTEDGRIFSDKTSAERHEEKIKNKTVHYILNLDSCIVVKALYLKRCQNTINVVDSTSAHNDYFEYETETGTVCKFPRNSSDVCIVPENQWPDVLQNMWIPYTKTKETLLNVFKCCTYSPPPPKLVIVKPIKEDKKKR